MAHVAMVCPRQVAHVNPLLEFFVYMLRAVIFVCVIAFLCYWVGMMIWDHVVERRKRLDALMRRGIRAANKRGWVK